MIKYNASSTGLFAKVENIKTKENFVVSTARNPYGVYETAVFRATNFLTALTNAFTAKPVFLANSPTLQQAEQNHITTAELFEQLDPKDMIRQYEREGSVGTQLLMSRKENDGKSGGVPNSTA